MMILLTISKICPVMSRKFLSYDGNQPMKTQELLVLELKRSW